ncbi:MAG: iron-containing alcohol dehydrogenase [Candidatus Heimdallarchaeota archaeon]
MWFFTSPRVVFGEDALEELLELEGQRAFIVTDKVLMELGLVQKVQAVLEKAGFEIAYFDDVESDPSSSTCQAGRVAMEEFAPDWIIAVGGGSVIDAAKAMWFLYERPDMEIWSIFPDIKLGLRNKARLVAIPTTSGTGSDTTFATIITDSAEGRKIILASREIVPDISIVDPSLVEGLPRDLTAMTGLDAITHAIEAYVAEWCNDFSDGLALHALRLAFKYLPICVADGTNMDAREHMHNAATLAGLAFGNSQVGIAHSMAHTMGALFHTPHGEGCGLFLPYAVEFNRSEVNDRYKDICQHLNIPLSSDEEPGVILGTFLRKFIKELGRPTTIAELGIDKAAFDEKLARLVEFASEDSSTLANPRHPEDADFEKLFLAAYDGKAVDF